MGRIVNLEVTYAACLLECGPPHILPKYNLPTATVGDIDAAREWFNAHNIDCWPSRNETYFRPWWTGYKKWYVENCRGN